MAHADAREIAPLKWARFHPVNDILSSWMRLVVLPGIGFVMGTLTTLRLSTVTEVYEMVPIHPGRVPKDELHVRELSASALARALRVPSGRIVGILNGKRAISAETALRLGRYLG